MDIGGELRTARLARALSIADIAHTTKINPRVLRAIENNAFDTVPRGPFMRGYLTAYARQVGLDGEDLIRSYRAEFDAPAPPPTDRAVLTPDGLIDPADASILSSQSERLQFVLIALIVAAVVYLGTERQPSASVQAEAPLAESSAAAATPPSDAASALKEDAAKGAEVLVGTSGTVATNTTPLTIALGATGPCWVEATADGARVFVRLMDKGDRQTIAARGHVTMRVGDPSTLAFTINGAAGRSLGPARRPVTVRIDPGNAAEFLAQ
jgi:cytoskeletal protein RodZ